MSSFFDDLAVKTLGWKRKEESVSESDDNILSSVGTMLNSGINNILGLKPSKSTTMVGGANDDLVDLDSSYEDSSASLLDAPNNEQTFSLTFDKGVSNAPTEIYNPPTLTLDDIPTFTFNSDTQNTQNNIMDNICI